MTGQGLSEHLHAAWRITSGSSLAAWGSPVKPPLQAEPSASQRGHRGGGKEGRGQTDGQRSLIKEHKRGVTHSCLDFGHICSDACPIDRFRVRNPWWLLQVPLVSCYVHSAATLTETENGLEHTIICPHTELCALNEVRFVVQRLNERSLPFLSQLWVLLFKQGFTEFCL